VEKVTIGIPSIFRHFSVISLQRQLTAINNKIGKKTKEEGFVKANILLTVNTAITTTGGLMEATQIETAPEEIIAITRKPRARKSRVEVSQMQEAAIEIDEDKPKTRRSAESKLQKILALWSVAVRSWMTHMWKTYVARGGRAVGKFLKKIGNFLLSLFNLNSPKKIDNLLNKTREVAMSAGQQALAAALMALLTSLAEGARVAMSELIDEGGSKVLQAIVEGAADSISGGTSKSQPTLFDQQRQTAQPNPFRNQYSNNSYDSSIPPWARS
jgi:hypothetical protein